jgi:hypothetical protein
MSDAVVRGAARAQPTRDASPPAAGARCSNCATPLAGRYCFVCGQDTVPAETALRSWRDQWHKLVRTLSALLLRPGLLTREHLDGGRVRYVAPFTLYLNTVAVFFVFSALFDFRLSSYLATADVPGIAAMVAKRAQAEHLSTALFLDHADHRFQTVYTLCLSLISVAGYALVARVMFRRHWHDFRGPLTFAMHFMAFVFIVFMPMSALGYKLVRGGEGLVRIAGMVVADTAALLIAAWFSAAIRRLFGDRWPWAIAKGVAITLLGIPINTLMWNAAMWITVATT